MRALLDHQRAHRLAVSGDEAPFIFTAGSEQLSVKLGEVPRFRDRHPVITPKVAYLAFDAAFFVWFGRRAEVALEPPVRAKGNEPRGFLAAAATQDLLHRTLKVVVPKELKHALEIMECVFVGFEERLLGSAMICSMEGRATAHAAHGKDLQQNWHALNSAHASYQST